jgi:PIN domain nuclease of toxin-antitoxin system
VELKSVTSVIYLDTHVVIWLYAGELEKFSAAMLNTLNSNPLRISPMVILEMEYLYEIKRIKQHSAEIAEILAKTIGLEIGTLPFESVVRTALQYKWTRDPFDRLIVAQAAVRHQPLVSKDEIIQAHYPRTIWSLDVKS